MNSRDFKVLFSYQWKSKHNAAAAAWNINAAIGNSSVNERTSDVGMQSSKLGLKVSQTKNYKPETVVDNEVLRTIVEKNPGNTVRDYAEELGVSPTTISRHLKLISKVKKNG